MAHLLKSGVRQHIAKEESKKRMPPDDPAPKRRKTTEEKKHPRDSDTTAYKNHLKIVI